jgi:hypothetical protein
MCEEPSLPEERPAGRRGSFGLALDYLQLYGPPSGAFTYGAATQSVRTMVVSVLAAPVYTTLMLAARRVGPALGDTLARLLGRLGDAAGGPGPDGADRR